MDFHREVSAAGLSFRVALDNLTEMSVETCAVNLLRAQRHAYVRPSHGSLMRRPPDAGAGGFVCQFPVKGTDMVIGRVTGSLAALAAAAWCIAGVVPASAQAVIVAPTAPPPPQMETPPPPPAAVDVWTPGHWEWGGSTWAWTPGQYIARPAPQATWVPGSWQPQGGGYVWVAGHWAG